MHTMTILAVEPGLSGGLANRYDGQPVEVIPMPAMEGDLVAFLSGLVGDRGATVAFVEEVGGYIGKAQPGSSAFKFGRNFGFLLGVMQTLGVRVELVRPQRWQKGIGLGT